MADGGHRRHESMQARAVTSLSIDQSTGDRVLVILSRLALASLAVLATLVIGGTAVGAASMAPRVHVGQVPKLPAGTSSIGSLSSDTTLELRVVLSPRDPAALERYVQEINDPGSDHFHHFLAPGAFGPRFGASKATIHAVISAMSALGLRPSSVAKNDLSISMAATAADAEAAFDVRIDRYRLSTSRTVYANRSAPSLPATIAGDVTDVIGLSDAGAAIPVLKQSSVEGSPASTLAPSGASTAGPTPCVAAQQAGEFTADQLAEAYGLTTGAYEKGRLGAGETIALPELTPYSSTDISTYEACYGVAPSISNKTIDGGPGTGFGQGEATGDIEDVAGLAPQASIEVYEAPDGLQGLYDAFNSIAVDDTAQVVSSSWLACESGVGQSFDVAQEPIFEQMAVQGQSVLMASGDQGSTTCHEVGGTQSPGVDSGAGDPYVTGVGGTDISAIGTPPVEQAWNNSVGSGGGGISSFWQMPNYQQAIGVHADSSGSPCSAPAGTYCREVPDVSAEAGASYGFFHNGAWGQWWGTSFAAPLWAAFVALADEGCATPAGFLNPELYAHSGDLNDVIVGNNDDTATGYVGGLYSAGPGYDMATGLGTPTAALLAPGVLCSAATGKPSVSALTSTPSSVLDNGGSVRVVRSRDKCSVVCIHRQQAGVRSARLRAVPQWSGE